MTMAEGGLFNGNEETSGVFTFASDGQSQSKEAKYHRAYRRDPQNKDRINIQKKRRRALKKEMELGSVSSMFESVARPAKSEPQTVEKVLNKSDNGSLSESEPAEKGQNRDFLSEVFDKLSKLDGGAFITNFPAAVLLAYCAYEASKFVVAQTLPMYQSLKFPDPELACYGAISLAIGFSVLSVISRSSLAKLFTAIIIAYEVILVFAGSQANQSDLSLEALKANPEHYEASEYYAITKSDYDRYKVNFESNNSKMFHNSWYKKTYLDPAQEKMAGAVSKLKSIEEKLESKYSPSYWELVLKVLYRLSAVAFVMLLAKESIKRGVGALNYKKSIYMHE
ncbi:MAG: hypothetical protein AB8G05_01240 [Oligoflexales bacterium]